MADEPETIDETLKRQQIELESLEYHIKGLAKRITYLEHENSNYKNQLDDVSKICRRMGEMYLKLTDQGVSGDAKELKRLRTLVEFHGLDET